MASFEMPTKLGKASRFAVVSPDKLSVKYTTVSQNDNDTGAVQANKPAPLVDRAMYYFELRVKNAGSMGMIGIGFTKDGVDLSRMPGWEANSIGYHGDDGKLYLASGRGEPFGPTFTTNDIVGAGINYASNEFFFTKNGNLVGKSSKEIDGPLFPTVAVHSLNEELKVNFGHKPFAYDIKLGGYPCPYCHCPKSEELRSIPSYGESWIKLLEGKDKVAMKSKSLLKKLVQEKENEVVSLKAAIRALSENL